MEDTTIAISRLRNKKKWAYSFHSELSLQTEEYLKNTRFKILKLGKLVAEISDGLHSTRHYVDDGIIVLAVRNITEFGLDLSNKKMITQAEHEHFKRSQVQPGDLLVTITGRLGTALVYTSEKPANLSAHVARVKVHANKVNPYYLAAYLNSNFGKQLLNEYSIGSIYPHINVNGLQNIQVILPPRFIQDRIAKIIQNAHSIRECKIEQAQTILNNIDPFILEKLGIVFEDLQKEKSFIITSKQIHKGRFDVSFYSYETNRKYQALSKQNNYKLVSLDQLILEMANGATPRGANYHTSGVPFLRIQNITPEGINFSDLCFIDRATHEEMRRSQTQPRDLLITITGRVGTAAIVPDIIQEANINQSVSYA